MGNNRQRRSSFFSCLNIFSSKRPLGGDDSFDDTVHSKRIYPSDYDRSHGLVADHKVDTKATVYINQFRERNIKAS